MKCAQNPFIYTKIIKHDYHTHYTLTSLCPMIELTMEIWIRINVVQRLFSMLSIILLHLIEAGITSTRASTRILVLKVLCILRGGEDATIFTTAFNAFVAVLVQRSEVFP